MHSASSQFSTATVNGGNLLWIGRGSPPTTASASWIPAGILMAPLAFFLLALGFFSSFCSGAGSAGTSGAASAGASCCASWGLPCFLSSSQTPPATETSALSTMASPTSTVSRISVFTVLRLVPLACTMNVSPTGLPTGRPMLLKNITPRGLWRYASTPSMTSVKGSSGDTPADVMSMVAERVVLPPARGAESSLPRGMTPWPQSTATSNLEFSPAVYLGM